MLRKIGQNYQIALPVEIVKMLRLHVNEYIDIQVKDKKIILEPQMMIPKDQAYFYSAAWQEDEAEATEDIKKGRVTKTKNLKDLLKKLDG
jgi:antitoxin MazE